MDLPGLHRTCPGDVPYLKRYETCAGHLRDICGTSYCCQHRYCYRVGKSERCPFRNDGLAGGQWVANSEWAIVNGGNCIEHNKVWKIHELSMAWGSEKTCIIDGACSQLTCGREVLVVGLLWINNNIKQFFS